MNKYLTKIEDYLRSCDDIDDPEFEVAMHEAVDELEENNIGIEAVTPILELMERHPLVEFGSPGALVHFVEKFYQKGMRNYWLIQFKIPHSTNRTNY